MEAITLKVGSTMPVRFTPELPDDGSTLTGVTFELLDAGGVAITGIPDLEEDGGIWSTSIPHTVTERDDAGQEWASAFLIETDKAGEAQYATVSARVFVVLAASPVEYAEYVEAGGAIVPFAKWSQYHPDAAAIVREVTLSQLALYDPLLLTAIFATADVLYKVGTAVASEKVGGYQVGFFASALPTRADAYAAARRTLAGTGLTYTGIDPLPSELEDPTVI